MSTFDPDALECLAAIVEEGGFERAARRLSITQSAVSQRLRALEAQVGTVLIVRSRPLKPTPAGQLMLKHAKMMRLLRADLEKDLKELAPSAAGASRDEERISVAMNADSIATWALPALDALARQGLPVEIITDNEEFTQEWLREGQVLGCVTSLGQALRGCRMEPLGVMDYVLIAQPDFAREHCPRGLNSHNFHRLPFIAFNRKDHLQHAFVAEAFGLQRVLLKQRFVPSSEGQVRAVLAGWGLSVVPWLLVRELIERGELPLLVERALEGVERLTERQPTAEAADFSEIGQSDVGDGEVGLAWIARDSERRIRIAEIGRAVVFQRRIDADIGRKRAFPGAIERTHVVRDGHPVGIMLRLGQIADPLEGPALEPARVGAEHDGFAGARLLQVHQHVECRGLAGAVRPEQTVDAALGNADGQTFDRGDSPVPLAELACDNDVIHERTSFLVSVETFPVFVERRRNLVAVEAEPLGLDDELLDFRLEQALALARRRRPRRPDRGADAGRDLEQAVLEQQGDDLVCGVGVDLELAAQRAN